MGLLFRRKILEVHPHEVERKDWENVLDDVFRKTVAKMLNGIAIICNTTRQHPGDGVGIVQNELTFHIKDKRADEVRSSLRKIDLLHFENIFENYLYEAPTSVLVNDHLLRLRPSYTRHVPHQTFFIPKKIYMKSSSKFAF